MSEPQLRAWGFPNIALGSGCLQDGDMLLPEHEGKEGLSSTLLLLITRAGVEWVIQTPHPTSGKAPRHWGLILEEPGTAPHLALL